MSVALAQDNFGSVNKTGATPPAMETVRLKITNIHDFLHLHTGNKVRNEQLETLNHLIRCQADMHESTYRGNSTSLGNAITKRASTFRGFIIHSEDGRPAAYCVYYPMVDAQGKRAAYCEDFYLVDAWRGHGIFDIALAELARRSTEENLEYIHYSTDARNKHFLKASRGKGVKAADITKWVCDKMIDPNFRAQAAKTLDKSDDVEYVTRPLKQNDLFHATKMGFGAELITNTGDLDFRGFITFRKGDKSAPVAITPGWKRLSTFELSEDIVLEQPRIIDDNAPEAVLLSIGEAAQKLSDNHLYWNIHDDADDGIQPILEGLFKAAPDSMKGDEDSRMIMHLLNNGALLALAQSTPQLEFQKPKGGRIGATSIRKGVANDSGLTN